MNEHLYLVTYDISDERRWRIVFRLMHGYGDWLQLSVFQCRLTRMRHAEMLDRLSAAISSTEDHVLIVDLGMWEQVEPRVQSLGKRKFSVPSSFPVIV
jgi:CRISPR-associated protein Cas2